MPATGNVYPFGGATNLGTPGQQGWPITSVVATPSGNGYWLLTGSGQVFNEGDAPSLGNAPRRALGVFNPATAIFGTSERFRGRRSG